MADVVVDTESKNPKELIGQGIRAYVLQDYNAAVTALSTASELLAKEHGDDLHDSLGEVYLYYGKALLGLSREESEALGDAVPKNAQEEDDDDDDDDEVVESPEESKTADEKDKESSSETPKEGESSSETLKDAGESSLETLKENGSENANGTTSGENNEPDACETTDEAAENEDEPTDLEVAWEVLELAKKIYQRHDEDGKKNLAETLIVLGEISLESENFEAAVNDIKEGLQIQKNTFGKDSRTVAESLYKLGIAYSTNSQIDEAIECFNESLQYLQNRISHLEKRGDNKNETEDEIKEIKSLLPDIEEKIVDMKTYKDETLKKIISAVTTTKVSDGSSSSGASSSKPAMDISHLVKRKRKADDEKTDCEVNPPKKPSI